MTESVFSGRIWILQDTKGRLIADIDTDQIYHNAFLHITDISQMGQYALGNLEDWKDFPQKVKPGDILVAGRNFGAGSSRQQAVDCFVSLKVGLIVAPSF
ncbi:MAG: 3-isopropylmalate dehydratase, partial [Nitrospira bacterium SG8_3]